MNGLSFTPEQSLPKIKQYCAYQERCHKEVKDKLYSFGLHKIDVEYIISKLIEEDYLNEERFAILYAGSKFRLKHWGKIKIKLALKEKFVSDYCIKKALAGIDIDDYERTLLKLVEEKLRSLKGEKNVFIMKRKLQDYLLQKGYGYEEIKQHINGLSIVEIKKRP
ncbi:MAG: regulatory protein RecX [Ginsengibacter sp.]